MSPSFKSNTRWQTLLAERNWSELFDTTRQEIASSFVTHQIMVFRHIGQIARQEQQIDLALRCFLYQKQLEQRIGLSCVESCGWISELYAEKKEYSLAKTYGEMTIALNQQNSVQYRPSRKVGGVFTIWR